MPSDHATCAVCDGTGLVPTGSGYPGADGLELDRAAPCPKCHPLSQVERAALLYWRHRDRVRGLEASYRSESCERREAGPEPAGESCRQRSARDRSDVAVPDETWCATCRRRHRVHRELQRQRRRTGGFASALARAAGRLDWERGDAYWDLEADRADPTE